MVTDILISEPEWYEICDPPCGNFYSGQTDSRNCNENSKENALTSGKT